MTVVIAGEPVAIARPRVTRRGITYTPAHTRKYEAHARLAAQLAMGDRPPIEVPVRLELVVELPIPDSWSGRRRALAITGDLLPTSRPDVDTSRLVSTASMKLSCGTIVRSSKSPRANGSASRQNW